LLSISVHWYQGSSSLHNKNGHGRLSDSTTPPQEEKMQPFTFHRSSDKPKQAVMCYVSIHKIKYGDNEDMYKMSSAPHKRRQ